MKFDWIKYFPFGKPRIEQENALNFAINQFKSGKRFVIIEAPTGTGKSGVAITLGKYFQAHMQKEGVKTGTYIITPQKILQAQYEREFPDISNISAKGNYTCIQRPGSVSCQIGQWMNNIALDNTSKALYNHECPYKIAKKQFDESILSLTNVAFMLNHTLYTDKISKRQLLIVDECHNLEAALIDFVAMEFDGNMIQEELKIPWKRINDNTDINVFTEWVIETYKPAVNGLVESLKSKLKIHSLKYGTKFDKQHMQLLNLHDKYDRVSCQLNRYLDHFNPKDWVLSVNDDSQTAKIQPIYGSKFAEQFLFKTADKVLLMSGTILDKKAFCINLGINQDDAAFLSIDSPFPKENRSVLVMDIGLMSKNYKDKTLPIMVKAIREILEEHKNDKGLIHTNSYSNAEYIKKAIGGSRLLLHNSKNRDKILQEHIKSDYPTVLISPSFTEGIDLYDELSRFQIIAKVPFPFLGDKYVRTKMERIKTWYSLETAKTLIQSSGRSIRSIDDSAVTYILDSSFIQFYNNNRNLFPKWWRESVEFI